MSTLAKTLPAFAALGVSALFLAAPQAAYAAGEVSCNASGQTHFLPGVQMFPQSETVTYRGAKVACVDHGNLGITSARISATFDDVDLSCVASDFGTGTGTATIEWYLNGAKVTSKADIRIDETVLNRARVSGVVTQGPFAGRPFRGEFDTNLLMGGGKCTAGALFGGVKSADFKGHFSVG
ncbi:hypothetical protein [Nonomuraea sp. SYSU D8015]|uniref:hypothetical protein n=1 Tax=Nonomuraea sp. SYSU D8015 TaxID=2593644 RepID=UPI0016616EC6|nr:hypothetical protein [Nonomuraea sp. SYSU D8015]